MERSKFQRTRLFTKIVIINWILLIDCVRGFAFSNISTTEYSTMSELQHVSATSLQPSFEVSHYLASSNIITTSLAVDVQSTFPLPVLVISEMTSLPTSTLASVSLQEQSGSAAEPSAGPFHMDQSTKYSGKVLAMMRGVYNMTMTVTIVGSPQLPGLLQGVFNFTTSGSTVALVLAKHVDLEALYKRAGEDPSVTHFQIKIDCTDATMIVVPPRLVNVTIADVDDSMPVFLHQETAADTDCVVPVYSAGTSEDYMGELSLSPGNIEAVDGDLTSQHNISYSVIHSEPEDYHVYFDVNVDTGKVNKTRKMNASSPNKYVLFVKAKEDSPQQRSRVAVLSIVVMSPVDPFSASDSAVNPTVKFGLQIASAAVLLAFLAGFVVIIHHRYRQRHTKIHTENSRTGNSHKIQFAVYESSNSSLNTTIPDNPASPSQVTLDKDYLSVPPWGYVGSGLSESNMSSISSERTSDASTRRGSVYSTQSQNKRTLIVTKPLDPKLRPGWNAPPPRPKRTLYNPLAIWNQSKPNGDKSGKIK
ncbi:uncharacterized protein LOC127856491 isoform X3 [Dreissena polymorpha]|uniref:uncharacterized protein LOC127856491 isoform X3 n=1 Tax=Dreissena polymorpha TaxID=45954 RepID=UPI002264E7E0|nr:uncharacterized protein LOC127856491 isoform X3 [Dreissena polymorpha]